MKHEVYFLISPKSELTIKVNQIANEDLSDLSKPVMWSDYEFDKSRLEHSDVDLITKIFFLDTLIRERSENEGFSEIFGAIKVSENDFDKLWTIQRIEIDFDVETAIDDAVLSGTIKLIAKTGNNSVDDFLDSYRNKSQIGT